MTQEVILLPDNSLVGWPWVPDSQFVSLPKVSLHDHLDGSIRPATLIEISGAQGNRDRVISDDPIACERWLRGIDAGDRPFHHEDMFALLCSAMQTPDTLARVAREYVETIELDGVAYAEVRWAPEKHLDGPMSLDDAVDAVRRGLIEGAEAAASRGHHIEVRQLLCAMRNTDRAMEIITLAAAHQQADGYPTAQGGVVGVDLAGMELGYPAQPHATAFQFARERGLLTTIHCGEGDGVASIWESLHRCYALRLGHGTRIVEDIAIDGTVGPATSFVDRLHASTSPDIEFGPVARYVRDRGLPFEQCPTSNSRWVVPGFAAHPVEFLHRHGFKVTINPDNRMLAGTSVSQEYTRLADVFAWTLDDAIATTRNGLDAAFIDPDTRSRLLSDVFEPGFVAARAAQ